MKITEEKMKDIDALIEQGLLDKETFRITPMGIIGPKKYQEIIEYAEKALDYDEEEGIPAIILKGPGIWVKMNKTMDGAEEV